MTQHRAWRVYFEHTSNRACINVAKLEFYAVPGGVDLTVGAPGGPICHDQSNGPASNAFDSDDTSLWHDSCGFNARGYIGWDFGSDNTHWQDVRGFFYRARNDSYANGDSIRSGGLEYSDDLTTWTRLFNIEQTDNWDTAANNAKYFWGKIDSRQDVGGFRFFKVEATADTTGTGADAYNGISKIELYNQSGVNVGQNLNDSQWQYRTLYANGAPQDGSIFEITSTASSPDNSFVQFANPATGKFFILDVGNENRVVLGRVRVYPSNQGVIRTWPAMRISGSVDGTAWTVLKDWTPDAWVAQTWQETTVPAITATADNAPHRYWRLWNTLTTGNPLGMSGLTFTDATRTPFPNGVYAASATYVPNSGDTINYSVSNLGDSSTTTIWAGPSQNEWVSIDYGTPVNPTYVQVTARGDADTNTAKQAPDSFIIQYSDDGVSWITKSKIDGFDKWGVGETRTFDIVFDSYKVGWDNPQNQQNTATYVSMGDLAWIDATTGSQWAGTPAYNPATMSYSYGASLNYYNSSNVISLFDGSQGDNDGNGAFFWYGNTADDRWYVQRVPKGTKLCGLNVWSRHDVGSVQSQSPSSIRVTKSTDNGLTYTDAGRGTFPSFNTEYQEQTVLFAPVAIPPKRDHYRLRVTDVNGSNYCSIDEIEWHTSIGGAQAATGGTVYELSTLNGYPGSNAYDGVTTSTGDDCWVGNGVGSALGYIWPNEINLFEYAIYGRNSYPDQLPKSWVIEYSDNGGATWNIIDRRMNITGWQEGVAQTFTLPPETTASPSRHRFWRLAFDPLNQYVGMRRLKFYDENGTDVTQSGTLSVTGSLGTTTGALGNLLLDDDSEFVYNGSNTNTALVFDFGDNTRDIESYHIWSRTSYSSNDCPRAWTLQFSDDNATWTSVSRIEGQEGWNDNTDRAYPRNFCVYRMLFTAMGASGYLGIPEVDFLVGGVSQIVVGDLWRYGGLIQYNGYSVASAFDGNTGSMYYVQSSAFNPATPPFLEYRMAVGTVVDQIGITPRQDGYASNDSPSELTLLRSDDNGLTYQVRTYYLDLYPWNDANRRVYSVPANVDGFARAHRVGQYIAEGPTSGTAQAYRVGQYVAEGNNIGASVYRMGQYIVEGPDNEDDDAVKPLYRPRQYFIN